MAFMRRDVNILLLLLVIVCALLFTGYSVYFQSSFNTVKVENQQKLDQLKEVTEELTSQKAKLNETYSLRIQAEQDRRTLDERFQDAADENDKLKQDNANLLADLSKTKTDYQNVLSELSKAENDLEQTKIDLLKMTQDRNRYKSDLKEVCDHFDPDGELHNEC